MPSIIRTAQHKCWFRPLLNRMQCSESSFKLYAIHIPLVAAGLVVGAALAWHVNLIHRRMGELPISSTWIPLLGSAIAFGTDPISLVLEGQKKGKDALGLLLAGSRMFILSDPRSHAALFKADKKQASSVPLSLC